MQPGGGIVLIDPIEEFIGQQLHSISHVDAGMMTKRPKGKKPFGWWPYQHQRQTRTLISDSHEDRLIGAVDKARKIMRTRQDKLIDLLEKGYTKTEAAKRLDVSRKTISRDVKKIKGRLKLCLDQSKKSQM